MMRWDQGTWGAGDWLGMSLMMVAVAGLLVALAVWLVRSSRQPADRRGDVPPTTSRAEDVLAERFARGDIDAEEFTRDREVLRDRATTPT